MKVASRLQNRDGRCTARLSTEGESHEVVVEAKPDGKGSRANGGELLCLALASCFCNDVYREARSEGIDVVSVEVEVEAEFGGVGEPARRIEYSASIAGRASEADLRRLVEHTDGVAEIHNTLRKGIQVELASLRVTAMS